MTPCVAWTGYIRTDGYGQAGRAALAHRAAWEANFGGIPEGYVVHHTCENKACVNPDHLALMTLAEHNRRHDDGQLIRANARRRAATHCKHGHPFDVRNTYWTRSGRRSCRRCDQSRPRRG